jgi:hypothetical protein
MKKRDRYASENARPFDPQWEAAFEALRTYLSKLADSLQEAELADTEVDRERRRSEDVFGKFRDAIQAIALDLYRAHLSDPSLEVGIGAGRPATQTMCSGQYGAKFLSARTFEDALRAMRSAKLILMTTEHWDDPTKQESRVRRYQASPGLLKALKGAGASLVAILRREDAEGIILKDKKNKRTGKKQMVAYGDVAFATEARDRLHIINRMLTDHWADLALPDEDVMRKLKGIAKERGKTPAHPPDLSARTVYRVFNNKDWQQGGRFNGAWWMNCPSDLRRHIVIDGKRTVEVDYSGLHAAMLFAEIGQGIPHDPYERCLRQTDSPKERKLIKLTFNALLNADSVQQLGKVKGYSEELTGLGWDDFKGFIVRSYPEFSKYFGSGVGLRLQRKDSDLAEAIMLNFAKMHYACLPIHDSFIVHHEMEDVLINTMKTAFQDMFGMMGEVKPELGDDLPVTDTGEVLVADIGDLLDPCGYEGRLQGFREMRERLEDH